MQSESASSEITLEESDAFEDLKINTIKGITSATISESRRALLITTTFGFVLCDLLKMQFARFEHGRSPFIRSQLRGDESEQEVAAKLEEGPYGSQLGSILETRTEVAVVPNFRSARFNPTSVYIYDYSTGIILSKFNFNLPITAFSLTNSHLIVANNKRIVLYNYRRSRPAESEQYYLSLYRSQEQWDFLRFIDLFCHLCDDQEYGRCECGRYSYSKTGKHMKMVYMRIGFAQNAKSRILYLYDQKLDKSKFFYEQKPYTDNFHFALAENAKHLAIADDYGRRINVYNLEKNCLYSVLYLGRESKDIVNLNVVTLPNGAEWVLAARAKEDSLATMHFFKLANTAATELAPSRYRRKFRLYKKTMRDYGVFARPDAFINPEYFLAGFKVLSLSMLGEYCELIDLDRAGLHDESTVSDYKAMEEYQPDL